MAARNQAGFSLANETWGGLANLYFALTIFFPAPIAPQFIALLILSYLRRNYVNKEVGYIHQIDAVSFPMTCTESCQSCLVPAVSPLILSTLTSEKTQPEPRLGLGTIHSSPLPSRQAAQMNRLTSQAAGVTR